MLIGLCGKKHVGKDTGADYLVEKHNFIKLSFAEPLKKICKIIFDFSDEQLNTDLKEVEDNFWKVTPRKTLQFIGTDLFRNQLKEILPNVENNIWVKAMERKIINIRKENPYQNIVISDVRFPNELQFIQNNGGICLKIIRTFDDSNQDLHISETLSSNMICNNFIVNNGSKEEFYKNIYNIIYNMQ